MAADIQTGEQCSSTGSMNAQKHLATTEASRKTLIVFLKIPILLEALVYAKGQVLVKCMFFYTCELNNNRGDSKKNSEQ